MTTREVRATLGGISQPRVSQLVHSQVIVAEPDDEGRLRYDRESVERYARSVAIKRSVNAVDAEEKAAMQAEARDRFRRAREREREEAERRQQHLDELREREIAALEGIHKCLLRR